MPWRGTGAQRCVPLGGEPMTIEGDDRVWHQWLMITVGSVLFVAISAAQGWLQVVVSADRTWISVLILMLLVMTTAWAGWRARQLVHHLRLCQRTPPPASEFARWQDTLIGPHAGGWFVTGLVVRLGLLGTVIGFMLMLNSLRSVETLDAGDVGGLIRLLGEGMGVSLTTTLSGLIASISMGLQMLALDRAAERLIAQLPRRSDPA